MSESWALQQLVYARLIAFAGVTALVGQRVYDAPNLKTVTFPYVSFGPSDIVTDDADCIDGVIETLQIDVWSRRSGGKQEAKQIANAVKAALHDFHAEPAAGALVSLRVATIRIFNDPDGITTHGVVTVEAIMEEA
jgi:hypothetical protein